MLDHFQLREDFACKGSLMRVGYVRLRLPPRVLTFHARRRCSSLVKGGRSGLRIGRCLIVKDECIVKRSAKNVN